MKIEQYSNRLSLINDKKVKYQRVYESVREYYWRESIIFTSHSKSLHMNDRNKSIIAKDWILKLANGINPLDGSAIPDGDIVNNVHITRCLFYVSELLGTYQIMSNKKSKAYENEFYIKLEDIEKVTIVERTGIASFVREINKLIPDNTRPISYGKILNWLMANGYLEEVEVDNFGKRKNPTASGSAVGISAGLREGTNGQYRAVEYNSNAQRFILSDINAISKS